MKIRLLAMAIIALPLFSCHLLPEAYKPPLVLRWNDDPAAPLEIFNRSEEEVSELLFRVRAFEFDPLMDGGLWLWERRCTLAGPIGPWTSRSYGLPDEFSPWPGTTFELHWTMEEIQYQESKAHKPIFGPCVLVHSIDGPGIWEGDDD